jgi:hypothetical protein
MNLEINYLQNRREGNGEEKVYEFKIRIAILLKSQVFCDVGLVFWVAQPKDDCLTLQMEILLSYEIMVINCQPTRLNIPKSLKFHQKSSPILYGIRIHSVFIIEFYYDYFSETEN